MAAGDASRTWFSEMIDALRQEWKSEIAWERVIALRDCLDAMLKEIRFSRGIRPPRFFMGALAGLTIMLHSRRGHGTAG